MSRNAAMWAWRRWLDKTGNNAVPRMSRREGALPLVSRDGPAAARLANNPAGFGKAMKNGCRPSGVTGAPGAGPTATNRPASLTPAAML